MLEIQWTRRTHRLRNTIVVLLVVVLFGAIVAIWHLFTRHKRPVFGSIRVAPALQRKTTYSVGNFLVRWEGTTGQFSIVNQRNPHHVIFSTATSKGFLAAGIGSLSSKDNMGYFTLSDVRKKLFTKQSVTRIKDSGKQLIFQGDLTSPGGGSVPYRMTLIADSSQKLGYQIQMLSPRVNRIYLTWANQPSDHYYGFGEQFTAFDMQGRRLPILVEEHGDGRGRQPLTLLADVTHGAGGNWYNTYAPVPHFISSQMQSLYSENSQYQVFDFTNPHAAQLEVDAKSASGVIFSGTTPAQLVQEYTSMVGRMAPLPNWTQQGLIFGAVGGTKTVTANLDKLLAYHVPITGLWIQDWVGQRKTSFGEQLWWNWVLNQNQYPDFKQFERNVKAHGIKLLGYINPFLVNTSSDKGITTNLYQIALANGYFVKGKNGKPVLFKYPGFEAALIDLTNPKARNWLMGVMQKQLIDNGFSGWMADFGEELPLNVTLSNGESGAQFHNQYPVAWAKLNQQVLKNAPGGKNDFFFMRSGFSTSPSYASSFWAGDQLESWGSKNGLESGIIALLSSGLSGYSINHMDIGGYTSIDQFPLHYVRTQELLMRWMEVAAFTPLFRSHEGNLPSKNMQIYSNPTVIRQLQKFATIYKALAPYREQLMKHAAKTGAPLVRPLFYNYPNDAKAYTISYQEFMLGRDLLMAPVTAPHVTSVQVYLPKGNWVELFTKKHYVVSGAGMNIEVQAPIGKPAVFYLAGSKVQSLLQH